MKGRVILFILFFNVLALGYSQTTPSKITYICATELYLNQKLNDGVNTLYFDQNKGLFIHSDYPKEDKYIEKGAVMGYVKGDVEGLPVFMNLQ